MKEGFIQDVVVQHNRPASTGAARPNTELPPPKRPRRKRRRLPTKILTAILIILVAAGIVVLVIKRLNAPAQGSVSETPAVKAEQQVPYSQPGTFTGKYVSYGYPAHYKPAPAKLSGSYLEVDYYSSTDQTAKQISVGVFRGDVNTDSGVMYRRQHPEIYRENTSHIGLEFTKTDGTEDTFFIGHSELVATVSAASSYGNLNNDALYVASSLKWLQ